MGSIKTLPYLTMFASTNLGGFAGDILIRQRRMPTATARKVVNTLGMPILLPPYVVIIKVCLMTIIIIMIICLVIMIIEARARCMWSKSELSRQTCSERLDRGVSSRIGLDTAHNMGRNVNVYYIGRWKLPNQHKHMLLCFGTTQRRRTAPSASRAVIGPGMALR